MAAAASTRLRPAGWCDDRATRLVGSRVAETGNHAIDGWRGPWTLPDGVGEGDEVVLVRMCGQWAGVAHQLPTARGGDPAGVANAQIPGMRFRDSSQWADDCGRVRVDKSQCRDRILWTPGPAAATGNIHATEAIARPRRGVPDTRSGPSADNQPLRMGSYDRAMALPRLPGSRRGRREIRGPLLPPTVPGWRSRAERFDMAVLEAYEPIERRWKDRVSALDVAVDEIPRIAPRDPDSVQWPPEVVADGPVALARLIPAGVDVRGNATRARIVLFRRPIERRAKDSEELAELLHEVLVAQVATYLGVEPSVIDPTIDD